MVDLADLQLSGWAQEAVATAQIEGSSTRFAHRLRAGWVWPTPPRLRATSRATAYRELNQLTEYGLLSRTGHGRGTRYALVEAP